MPHRHNCEICRRKFRPQHYQHMTCMLYIKSLISTLQNRGGYRCHAVIDNSLYRIYHALSWLFAAASAFLQISNHYLAGYMPLTSIGTSSEPDRNLIGISPKGYRGDTEGTQGEYIRDITLEQGLAQSDKVPQPLHFTPYALATIRERQRATFALATIRE